jgi:hypothetical protein
MTMQMSAMSIFGANLIDSSMVPLSLRTGATSESDPSAGGTANDSPSSQLQKPITTADKAGAAILTILACTITIGGAWWLVT